jgi:hypothetical protein
MDGETTRRIGTNVSAKLCFEHLSSADLSLRLRSKESLSAGATSTSIARLKGSLAIPVSTSFSLDSPRRSGRTRTPSKKVQSPPPPFAALVRKGKASSSTAARGLSAPGSPLPTVFLRAPGSPKTPARSSANSDQQDARTTKEATGRKKNGKSPAKKRKISVSVLSRSERI